MLRTYTAEEEHALDTRLTTLEADIIAERRRRWGVQHRRRAAERGLGDAREAVEGLRAVAAALQHVGGAVGGGSEDGDAAADGGGRVGARKGLSHNAQSFPP